MKSISRKRHVRNENFVSVRADFKNTLSDTTDEKALEVRVAANVFVLEIGQVSEKILD